MEADIKTIRKQRGIKFTALAELAQINKGRLSLIERGYYIPTWAEVQRLEGVLGEPIEIFVRAQPR